MIYEALLTLSYQALSDSGEVEFKYRCAGRIVLREPRNARRNRQNVGEALRRRLRGRLLDVIAALGCQSDRYVAYRLWSAHGLISNTPVGAKCSVFLVMT
jgi:hypothetical protein